MADCALILKGSMAGVFCKGLVETGKFIRLLSTPSEQASGLYGSGVSNYNARGRIVWESHFARGVIARAESSKGSGNGQASVDDDDKDDEEILEDTRHKGSKQGGLEMEYAVRGSAGNVSAVLVATESHKDAFLTEKRGEAVILHCVGSQQETIATLKEIRSTLA